MERDIVVNYNLNSINGNRVPRDVEVFNREELNSNSSEAIDMNESSVPDVDSIDRNMESDVNVNFTMAERDSSRVPRDVEIFDPELASELSRVEYSDSSNNEVINDEGIADDNMENEKINKTNAP